MATTCNFGQIKDLRIKNLCLGGKIVIDNNQNLSCIDSAKVKKLLVRKNATICGTLTCDKIIPKNDAITVCGDLIVTGTITPAPPAPPAPEVDLPFIVDGDTTDFLCGNIGNVQSFVVNDIFSKGLDVGDATLENVVRFRDGCVVGFTTTGGGAKNQFWGFESGYAADGTAENNVSMGYQSLRKLTDASDNVAIGMRAGHNIDGSSENVAIGSGAMYSVESSAQRNVAIGFKAMYYDNDGETQYNVVIGWKAAASPNFSGTPLYYQNTVVGARALWEATYNGGYNVIIGCDAAEKAEIGQENVAIGNRSMSTAVDKPNNNVAIGYQSLCSVGGSSLGEGDDNVAIGHRVAVYLTTGADNVIIGAKGGNNVNTGNRNVLIGRSCAVASGGVSDSIAIGYQAQTSNSFQIAIGTDASPSSDEYCVALTVNNASIASQTITPDSTLGITLRIDGIDRTFLIPLQEIV